MKISLNWIKDYVDLTETNIDTITQTLTDKTSEVEEVFSQGEGLEKVFVGEILEITAHPDADRMRVTQTKVGNETFQIVCGAPNIEVGQKVPVAIVGAVLPGNFEIKKADKRGVESCGMICSERELGISDESEGIMVLPEDAPLGAAIIEYLNLNDNVFEIENTTITNRPDLFSHIGYAREFAAIGLGKSKSGSLDFEVEKIEAVGTPFPLDIQIEDQDICRRLCAVQVKNFQVAPSPKWMQERLQACDIRPINNLVDITNYVMLEMGMPLHAFDLDSIKGNSIKMRLSKEGEKVTTLDDQERTLVANIIIQEDEEKVFDLCGIMGGANSEVQDSTNNVWVHSAVYHPVLIRRASVALNHRTDASVVYEKQVAPRMAAIGLARAVELMKELCPECEVASDVLDINNDQQEERVITLRTSQLTKILGEELNNQVVSDMLTSLGCKVQPMNEGFEVSIPFFRMRDLEIEEDLIEEVVRLHGVKNVEAKLPTIAMEMSKPVDGFVKEKRTKDFLAQHAYENVNFSFLGEKLLEKCAIDAQNLVEIANSISEELSLMRPSLIPYLLQRVEENSHHDKKGFALFELGKVFSKKDKQNGQTSHEEKQLAYLAYKQDFSHTKAVLEELFETLQLKVQIRALSGDAPAIAHPGQVAEIFFQGKVIGHIASLHPQTAKAFDIEAEVTWFELNFEKIEQAKMKAVQYATFNKLPSVERDQNFEMDKKVAVGDFVQKLGKASKLIVNTEVVDIYEGKGVAEDKKRVTVRTTYQADDRTLTDQEVDEAHKSLLSQAEKII